jgi:hypothetical protein
MKGKGTRVDLGPWTSILKFGVNNSNNNNNKHTSRVVDSNRTYLRNATDLYVIIISLLIQWTGDDIESNSSHDDIQNDISEISSYTAELFTCAPISRL